MSKIFNNATILKKFTINVGGIELSKEDIINLSIEYSLFNSFVKGSLSFKDSFQLSDLNIWNTSTLIEIYAVDLFDNVFERRFICTNVSNDNYNERFKQYSISFMDELSFNLMNTYISKGFTENMITSFQQCIEKLIDHDVIEQWPITFNSDTVSTKTTFCIPGNMSLYDFYLYQFRKENIRFYYKRNNVFVEKIDFSSLETNEDLYTNNTDNDSYAYKIHDFSVSYNNTIDANNIRPEEENIKFDINKIENTISTNLNDVKNNVSFNNISFDIIKTNGKKLSYQEITDISSSTYDLEELLLHNNTLQIVVPGNFLSNDIGRKVNVVLKGNPMITSTSLEGDTFHSGVYLITNIKEAYLGDKMIQRLTLSRYDFGGE